ncbi:MAG TPA: Ku protein [Longimicrobiales bacterium]|nr:Ku protein [Longimicrobiales bacterium]
MPETDEREADIGPRSFWSGTITFGLVSIPVELYPAHRSSRVSLRMVSPEGTPLERRYFCAREERELDWGEIVRGYELEKGSFVVVTDDELEKLAPDRTRDIDLRRFVPANDIDPMHFERAYFLTPGGNSTKAYRLLAATMEKTGRAGIATFVMRGKEYLIAILAENGILRAETLRFADEVRTPDDVGLPEPARASATAVKKIEKAIRSLTRDALDESQLEDAASARLIDLARRKAEEGEDVVAAPDVEAAPPADGVLDLMAVLKRSLEGRTDTDDAPAGRSTPRKSAAKKTATKKAAAKKTAAKKTAAKKTAAKK